MGILNEIAGVLVAGGGGGLLGVIGSIGNRVMAHKERKQANEHEVKMAGINRIREDQRQAHEVKLHELNIAAQKGETERELAVIHAAGSWDGLKASHATAAAEAENFNGSKWVEDYKGQTRPTLTFLLWVLVLIAFVFVPDEPRVLIIESLIFCATASTLWWFGDRAPKYKALPSGALS